LQVTGVHFLHRNPQLPGSALGRNFMRRAVAVLSALTLSLGAATAVASTANAGNDNDPYTLSGGHAGPMSGIVYARGEAGNPHGGGSSAPPLLTWHGGTVQSGGTTVSPVYWGVPSTDPIVNALHNFYVGASGSNYLKTNTEFTNGGGQPFAYNGLHVSPTLSVGANNYDTDPAPSKAPSTSAVLNAVNVATGGNVTAGAYYPVYTNIPRGHAGYCAWHSAGTINGTNIQFAFFFNLTGDRGCMPDSSSTNIQALGNVSGHELSEMLTDPQLNAWYDQQGAENSDKCAWTFGSKLISLGSSGSWKIQGNFSDQAAVRNVGYANIANSGATAVGCVDGTNASAPTS